ncbi:hypothetical protein [Haladaptatus sp. W1]|uniref:hypothetical protein n=1 Tax=Haladaptatus sp. W1 TaxID=1897478 RepID=UPI001586AAF7|nr:hypothetical protein [Haladaptatus sp. W1]
MTTYVTAVETSPVSVPAATAYETNLSVTTGGQGAYDHVFVKIKPTRESSDSAK